ncbi:hypothetical protein IW261DRAFT_865584 [Armillaria novae-zelandiae]|uniref:Mid2 domain-containing protein n=1 Tax=Armillaria novae-zelandiae TaxID=153914 RepID=A0AA39PIW0_9AGAR|nr:hypothetical protein IW261DRAFT_865584 [Armillaria novae-zelandiae]
MSYIWALKPSYRIRTRAISATHGGIRSLARRLHHCIVLGLRLDQQRHLVRLVLPWSARAKISRSYSPMHPFPSTTEVRNDDRDVSSTSTITTFEVQSITTSVPQTVDGSGSVIRIESDTNLTPYPSQSPSSSPPSVSSVLASWNTDTSFQGKGKDVAIAGGVACAVVVFAIGVIIFVIFHYKKRKRRYLPGSHSYW